MAVDDEAVPGKSLPGGLQVPARGRRLEHECRYDVPGRFLDERPSGEAADLLVGCEEDAGGASAVTGFADRLDENDEPRLHVVGAGAVGATVLDPEGHVRERPDLPDRVDVAKKQERGALAGEADAEVVAGEGRLAAVRLELGDDAFRDGAEAFGPARRRLDFDELTEEVERRVVANRPRLSVESRRRSPAVPRRGSGR
jgi:hypothetical protein